MQPKGENDMRSIITRLLLGVSVVSLVSLSGCSGSSSGDNNNNSAVPETVSGTASKGAAYTGTVTLKDSKRASRTTTASTNASTAGFYSIDVTGLTPPFFITAGELYSVATGKGTANVNPLTDLVARSVIGVSPSGSVFESYSTNRANLNVTKINEDMEAFKNNLNSKLAPLYAKYQLTTPNFQSGAITIDKDVDALFRDIKVTVSADGAFTIKDLYDKKLVDGSLSGIRDKSSIFTSYSSIKNLPGVTVTVTTATCDAGYVGATATTSIPIPGNCGTVTYCVSQTNPTGLAYYLIGGKKITIDLAQMIPSVTNTSYMTYIQKLGQDIAAACTK
jgi:hypothetical protein